MEASFPRSSHVKPGGHELRREVVVHHQRERILAAVVQLVAERGYRAVSVAAIVKQARTGRLKFYELFDSKEDCFLAAYDAGLDEAGRRVDAALEAAGEKGEAFADRLDAGIGALLGFLDERPDLARATVVEAPLVGAAMSGHRNPTVAFFAPLLAGARSGAKKAKLPADLEESVLDGLYWLLYDAILSGKPKRLTRLRPSLVEFAAMPFVGPATQERSGMPS
jgi:AcrR family transcriptional regulator